MKRTWLQTFNREKEYTGLPAALFSYVPKELRPAFPS